MRLEMYWHVRMCAGVAAPMPVLPGRETPPACSACCPACLRRYSEDELAGQGLQALRGADRAAAEVLGALRSEGLLDVRLSFPYADLAPGACCE